ncbi:MAG TPA: methyltransferase domain-containing protein [Mycobacteriales bacterium]|nr:methyltransferase domain-containing protein [Mycobacteriales bacterium]
MLSSIRPYAARIKRAGQARVVGALHPPPRGPAGDGVVSHLDEVSHAGGVLRVRGWLLHPEQAIAEVGWSLPGHGYRRMGPALPSPDVAGQHGSRAAACRFDERIPTADPGLGAHLRLHAQLADGRVQEITHDVAARIEADPYHQLQARFFAMLAEQPTGRVAELGSRARSGNVRRDLVPSGWDYVGLDILPGPNVDVVADAHDLHHHLEPLSCDAVFSFSTFEHLAMPWRVAVELNAVMSEGGLLLITSHQTYPLHDEPWDFWRFSSHAWPALFNAGTGFEVLGTAMGEPASVVPHLVHPTVAHLDRSSAFLGSAVLARKVSGTRLSWDHDLGAEVTSPYPV